MFTVSVCGSGACAKWASLAWRQGPPRPLRCSGQQGVLCRVQALPLGAAGRTGGAAHCLASKLSTSAFQDARHAVQVLPGQTLQRSGVQGAPCGIKVLLHLHLPGRQARGEHRGRLLVKALHQRGRALVVHPPARWVLSARGAAGAGTYAHMRLLLSWLSSHSAQPRWLGWPAAAGGGLRLQRGRAGG